MLTKVKAKKFMELAEVKARLFSKDTATQVCAIILAPDSLEELTSGWNGMPRSIDETIASRWERPIKYKWVEHAERNAIYNASRRGTPLEGGIMIVNRFPCADCARAIIQCGITRVITKLPEDNPTWHESWRVSSEMLAEAGVTITNSEFESVAVV